MVKKKRGSSLILVIVVFFMLITFGTVIVSATVTGYKSQINESKRAHNLYAAESGLDATYNIIAKAYEAAIVASNKAVETTLYAQGGKVEIERSNLERYNKGEIVEFLFQRTDTDKRTNPSSIFKIENSRIVIDREGLSLVEDSIFQKNFKLFLDKNLSEFIQQGKYVSKPENVTVTNENINNGDSLYYEYSSNDSNFSYITYENDIKPNFTVTISYDMDNIEDGKNVPKAFLTLESQFYTGIDEEVETYSYSNILVDKPGMQERVITVKYDLDIPRYNPTNTTKKIQIIKRPIFDNSFAVDGNIYLSGNVEISGDVYAKGDSNKAIEDNDNNVSNSINNVVVFDKYKDGITVEENSEVIINGDVVTTKSFSLRNDTKLIMNGSMYALNLHLGKYEDFTSNVSGSNILVNALNNEVKTSDKKLKLYLHNDLSIYADNSTVNLEAFYGLNDVNGVDGDSINKSSSIIVNSTNNVNLNINKDAYIFGTAYINTDSKYQTGESVAIKGNYKAYTTSLEGEAINGSETDKYTGLQFIYDKPLQLVVSRLDGENQIELNVTEKAQYFKDYAEKNSDELVKTVEVNLPDNTFSVGAYIDGNEVKGTSSAYLDTIKDEIITMQSEFAKKVYGFGVAENDFYNPTNEKSVSTELNLSKLPDDKNGKIQGYGYDVIFNKDKDKKVILIGNGLSNEQVENLKSESNTIIYDFRLGDTSNNKENSINKAGFEGLILTDGDVEIYGAIEFKGSIIAGGNLICNKDSYKKKFTYDSKVVKEIIAYFYDDLYKENNPNESVIIQPNDDYTETVEIEYSSSKQHNVKDYIKQGLWNIKK